jgi:hypothetical protein
VHAADAKDVTVGHSSTKSIMVHVTVVSAAGVLAVAWGGFAGSPIANLLNTVRYHAAMADVLDVVGILGASD